MSVLSHFEDHKRDYSDTHSWGDLLATFQIPIALIALALLFILN